jgi:hypothetical protein
MPEILADWVEVAGIFVDSSTQFGLERHPPLTVTICFD